MNRRAALALAAVLPFAASACALTHHSAQPSSLGQARRSADMVAVMDQPGPITVETVNAADWAVDLSGMVDMKDPKVKAAGIKDHLEPIQVYFHVIRHPTRGTFIVDSGVEKKLRDDPKNAAIRGFLAHFMHMELMKIHVPLAEWVAAQKQPLQGVLMTHLHLDHISGLADLPPGTPIYAGPKEASEHSFANMFLQPNADRELAGQAPISEWQYQPDPDGRFAGVVDVFGDGSLWAISVPGHTPGSTAYLARTPDGPVLLTGDACHTIYGWQNDVAPGSFTADHKANEKSLAQLRKLAAEHPKLQVRLGHQALPGLPAATVAATAAQ
jgi:glyoxylase-like metal-dependent hydrolase (beta-lactamase superfamily II)